jgi:hypothetical protein
MLMRRLVSILGVLSLVVSASHFVRAQSSSTSKSYVGFDRNDYPGDQNLAALRKDFSFAGYWLNVPPGAKSNSWTGKRSLVRDAGFGFLVLFNGRLDAELKKIKDAAQLGGMDAAEAVAAAQHEGFPAQTVIFLDIEEGGRMLPEQKAYVYAWVDHVNEAGFRAGVYCSGIAANEGGGVQVTTAKDLRENAKGRKMIYWVVNDSCPPSPGCTVAKEGLVPASALDFADVWQFAQSPKRRDFAGGCHASYDRDGNCYAPATRDKKLFLDLNAATSPDPSGGR